MDMEKYVYRITNLVNGKVYIGQTNNLDRRWKEHLYDKRNNHPIHSALIKYGKENFRMDTLYYGVDYNEEEKKWISFYDSQNPQNGYNIVAGGQDSSGESNPAAKITQEQVDKVIELLLTTEMTYKEIAETMNVGIHYIAHINNGESWRDEKYNYPIRPPKYIDDAMVDYVIQLLKNPNLTLDDIEEMSEVKRYTILSINKGQIHKRENETYPIREVKMPKTTLNQIIDLLKNTDMYYREIAKITGTSISIVSNINKGATWHNDEIDYPIRKKAIVMCSEHD